MTASTTGGPPHPVYVDEQEISLLALASTLLRWRRTIIVLAVAGGILGLVMGLTTTRVYRSTATFIPQGSDPGATSGLAAAARQFGIGVPSTGGNTWGPTMYVELIKSRALLEPIAYDTFVVAEKGGKRVPVMDLLGIGEMSPPQRRVDRTVSAIAGKISAAEARGIGGVQVTVRTPWPSVSVQLADRLLHRVNQFNIETRKSQAGAERQFAETQSAEAALNLRAAEDRLQMFLQRNRVINSPQLRVEQDRLEREVMLRQQIYTSLLQSREDARMREVRDTPVITIVERPRLPEVGESRKSVRKALIGAITGGAIGVLLAFLAHAIAGVRRAAGRDEDAREFFALLEDATPRVLRKVPR